MFIYFDGFLFLFSICLKVEITWIISYLLKSYKILKFFTKNGNLVVYFLPSGSTTVAFTARLSNDTELAAIETVVFDNILLNSGNAYNERNGQFTAPVAGTYQFAVSLTNFGKESHFAVQKNGNDALSRLYIKSGLTYSTSSVVVAHLDAGDIVHVQSQYFPTNLRQGKYSVFSGFLIK